MILLGVFASAFVEPGTEPPATTTSFYGPAYNMDGLGNAQVGGPDGGVNNVEVAFGFKAEKTGTIVAVRNYWLDERYSGYGGGNGGIFRLSIYTESDGVPGTEIGYTNNLEPPAPPSSETIFYETTLTNTASVTKDNYYFVVFKNIDSTPITNFSSVNMTWMETPLTPKQPRFPDTEYKFTRKFGSSADWGNYPELDVWYTPIVDLRYSDGFHQGQGYMEVEKDDQPIINGSTYMMREHFTVSGGDKTVTGVAVRLAKSSGTGNLTVRLEDDNESLIADISIPTSSVPVQSPSGDPAGVWVTGTFSTPQTLTDSETYNVVLLTDSSTTLWSRCIQKGAGWDMDAATYFNDGYAQYTTNGGSTWVEASGLATDGDMQFYFTTSTEEPPGGEEEKLTANQQTGTDTLSDTTGFAEDSQTTIASSTAYSYAGSRSLELTAINNYDVGCYLEPLFSVTPSGSLRVSGRLRKAAAVTAGHGLWSYIAVYWFDANDDPSSTPVSYGTEVEATNTWQLVDDTLEVPADATQAQLYIVNQSSIVAGDKFYWDALSAISSA